MLIDVTKYHGGICPGVMVATLNKDCTVTCETVPEDGMLEVDACCNPLMEIDMAPCPELEEQVDCGPCSNGCGGSSSGGDAAEDLSAAQQEQVVQLIGAETPALVAECLEQEQAAAEAGKE